MNTALWIAQGILAFMFGYAGYMKAFVPLDKLKQLDWAPQYPRMTRFIGVAEIAGAIGMILPILLDILPWLTPLAAFGFAAIQVLAIGFHYRRNELMKTLVFNLILLGLSLFVAIGRIELF